MTLLKKTLFAVTLPALLIAVWWLATELTVQTVFVPQPGPVFEKLVTVWFGELFFSDVVPSVMRLLAGLALSITVGVVFGLLIGSVRWIYWATEPLLEFIRAIPATILIPILLLVVGINESTRTIVVLAGCVWPILLNTISGVQSIDEVLRDTARVYRISGFAKVRYLLVRGASPQIIAGIRQSLAIGLILIVVAEMFAAASDGIGYQLNAFQGGLRIPEMWAGIFLLSIVGLVLNGIFQIGQRVALRWYRGVKEGVSDG